MASVAVHLVDLVRPWRTLAVSVVDLGINLLNLFIITQALGVDRYFEVTGAPEHADTLARANYWFNQMIEWVFMTIGAVIIFEVCFEIWRIMRARREFRMTPSSTAP